MKSIPPRIGLRAHDIGCLPAGELARRIAATGAECVQLALGKAIAGIDLQPGVINRPMALEIGRDFAAHHVGIEVLGCYINPIYPDLALRRSLYGLFKEHLRHARDFGCEIVALESGSMNADYSPHPGNTGEAAFQELLAGMTELVDEAERCGVVVGLEPVASHVIHDPARMARLLDALPSPHLQVVFDPVNLLCPENHQHQQDVMRRSFDLFGERIRVIHAKDFVIGNDGLEFRPAGLGLLDYDFLMDWVAGHKPGVAFLLEGADTDHVSACIDFIRLKTRQHP